MPTPVGTARQCLTEEAGRALDDAVTVAKRRHHAQTTSLHAVSALLSPSLFLLRDSLSRAPSSAYSPRLQLRALELCVGVSLDRLPSSKSKENDDFAPPISNSLMAAIKRSQARQRRQPDMYHLNQIHYNSNNLNNNNGGQLSISCIKVELKHFVLSILDDPIISRVLGEAGFRSSDIKMGIIHTPRWGPSIGIATPRRPPMFLCNYTAYAGGCVSGNVNGDENCKRIGEVMVKNRERNPVLVGAYAENALARFKERVLTQKGLQDELNGVKLVCFEREIKERENEGLDLKMEEVKSSSTAVTEDGVRTLVNLGELNALVSDDDDDTDTDEVTGNFEKELVNKLSKLVDICGKNVWLIAQVADYETYSKFVGRFPSVDKDWDLQPLPITSSSSCNTSFEPKSSLMGSFVPFGGFFPTPSDYRPPLTAVSQPFTRCNACNESYEWGFRDTLRESSSVSVSGDLSSSLPSWLQRAESEPSKAGNIVAQVKDVRDEQIQVLQKKWDDHCRLVHQKYPFSVPPVSLAALQVAQHMNFQLMANKQATHSNSSDSSLNDIACSNSGSSVQIVAHNTSPQKQVVEPDFRKIPFEISECHSSPIMAHKLLSTVAVTTDLGLGMVYSSKAEEVKNPFPISPSNQGVLRSESIQTEGLDLGDYKPLFRKLCETVSWQSEAICRISEIVSRCKSGNGHQNGTKTRGNIWLSFLGPDKIGQKRIAQSLADAIHGSRDRLIALNLSYQERTVKPDSIFLRRGLSLNEFDINSSRITFVDHIAQELSRKPQSVVFLENVDDADPLVQNSLSRAIRTGKFSDSRGKEIAINSVVFVMSSRNTKGEKNQSPRREFIKFLEEKVLEAKNWQMKLSIRNVPDDASRSNETTVSLLAPKCAQLKRKLSGDLEEETKRNKKTEKSLDLNLSLEMDCYDGHFFSNSSKAWLEDFLSQVDGNVTFKSFDFDALADALLKKVRLKLEEIFRPGPRVLLEIAHEVMLQILGAAWFADNKGAAEEWIEQVLGPNLSEARDRYNLNNESVVRLSSCEGAPVKEWASGINLPRRINLSI